MSKVIKVSDKTYERLLQLQGFLQIRHGKHISLDYVIQFLLEHVPSQKLGELPLE